MFVHQCLVLFFFQFFSFFFGFSLFCFFSFFCFCFLSFHFVFFKYFLLYFFSLVLFPFLNFFFQFFSIFSYFLIFFFSLFFFFFQFCCFSLLFFLSFSFVFFFLFYLSEGFELTIPTRCLTLIRPTQMQSERRVVRFKVSMLPITKSNFKEVNFVSVVKVRLERFLFKQQLSLHYHNCPREFTTFAGLYHQTEVQYLKHQLAL